MMHGRKPFGKEEKRRTEPFLSRNFLKERKNHFLRLFLARLKWKKTLPTRCIRFFSHFKFPEEETAFMGERIPLLLVLMCGSILHSSLLLLLLLLLLLCMVAAVFMVIVWQWLRRRRRRYPGIALFLAVPPRSKLLFLSNFSFRNVLLKCPSRLCTTFTESQLGYFWK